MKLFNTFILFILVCMAASASPADSLKKANNLYAENEFHTAALIYEGILEEGYESAALYYNLGNAYYKIGEYTRAILNYERALLLDPGNESITFNLNLANEFVIDNIEALPTPFLNQWIDNMANLQSAKHWSYFSIAAFFLVLLALIFFLFSRTVALKKTGFAVAIVLFTVTISTFLLAQKQHKKIVNSNYGIIFTPTVTVKASPDAGGTDLFVIHEGLKVEVKQQVNQWIEIRLEDGNSGWVQNNVLEII